VLVDDITKVKRIRIPHVPATAPPTRHRHRLPFSALGGTAEQRGSLPTCVR
jgi:hypothetical protein